MSLTIDIKNTKNMSRIDLRVVKNKKNECEKNRQNIT